MSLLSGKIVCITGSSRGIGKACALQSTKHGAIGLILHYYGDEETSAEITLLKEEIEGISTKAKVVTISGDIGDPKTSAKVCEIGLVIIFTCSY